jgi:hypothetical protein
MSGELAQLARASALHAEGHRFDSDILHIFICTMRRVGPYVLVNSRDDCKRCRCIGERNGLAGVFVIDGLAALSKHMRRCSLLMVVTL